MPCHRGLGTCRQLPRTRAPASPDTGRLALAGLILSLLYTGSAITLTGKVIGIDNAGR
jgi:hypothetical protein